VEAGWLAYPVLGFTGLKMLLEDLPRGRPATLILAFAFYGLALILVPRIRSRRGEPVHPA
jgi:predicted tellurium resistance membrane protein TerC